MKGSHVRVLVLGGDGYLGWPLALHLSARGHAVGVLDSFQRRAYDRELGTVSLAPIETPQTRVDTWLHVTGQQLSLYGGDLQDYTYVEHALRDFHPDAVVHLAEQRSAPYSMMSRRHAVHTQQNNVLGTLNLIHAVAAVDPTIHVVKLGTMGEYGTPNLDIEEGWLDVTHNGRTDRVLYPKRAGSWYHLSKVHDSHNLEFACRAWDLRVTDLNQGVVYGHWVPETAYAAQLRTRLDYDAVFGTVLNRFAVQAALGLDLTVYGAGTQVRGFIDLRDAVRCIELACLHPAEPGEFRVFNQLTETFSVLELACRVARLAPRSRRIKHLENPRVEMESHYYRVAATGLPALGLEPHHLTDGTIEGLIEVASKNRDRVDVTKLEPQVTWHPTAASSE